MATESPFPEVNRIIADSDLDGMCAAVVLKKAYPDAEVHFAHAALIPVSYTHLRAHETLR